MLRFTRFSHICPPKLRNVFTGVLLAQAMKLLNQSFCRPPKVCPISCIGKPCIRYVLRHMLREGRGHAHI